MRSIVFDRNVYWTTNPRTSGIAVLHGIYGLGAMSSPLTCQIMMTTGYTWRQFFFVSIAVAGINVAYNLWVFYPTQVEWEAEKQVALAERMIGHTTLDANSGEKSSTKRDIESAPVIEQASTKRIGTHFSALSTDYRQ
jgi:hypothetical protein